MARVRAYNQFLARRLTGILSTVALCGVMVVAPVSIASADETQDPAELEVMGNYDEALFAAEATLLPPELVVALDRDMGLTAPEYLAESEASLQAVDVVDSLREAGVSVLGSSIDGTTLTVNVGSEDAVALVESTGAIASVGEPDPYTIPDVELKFSADIHGGQGYYWETGNAAFQCSIGFNGYLTSTGAPQLVTAGHCVEGMAGITGSVRALNFSSPGTVSSGSQLAGTIGLPVGGSMAFGGADSGYDLARIAADGAGLTPRASALTWGGSAGAPLSSAPRSVTGQSAAIIGATLCKSGSRTGWRCGPVVDIDYQADVGGIIINSIIAEVCSLPGDSGGSALIGSAAVGISSWTNLGGSTCAPTADEGVATAGFFPMVSSGASTVTKYGTSWEIAATVPTPLVTSPTTVASTGSMTGTLASASASSTVALYLDGATSALATVTAATGSWSIPLAGVASGVHTYRLVGGYGQWSKSTAATGSVTVRISGPEAITQVWEALGGAAGSLGASTSGVRTLSENGGGMVRSFQNGDIAWSSARGAFAISGPTFAYYTTRGGPAGALGWPMSGANSQAAAGGGTVQAFQFGAVTSSALGAFALTGAIRTYFGGTGGIAGPLGWPASDAVCASGRCDQSFQGGRVFESAATGAWYVPNAIVAAYDAAGGPSGSLGWPVSGPSVVTANGGGTVQGFAGGAIVSSPAGAFLLTQPIRGAFGQFGGIGGAPGWPTSAASCDGAGVCSQSFQGGRVMFSPSKGAGFVGSAIVAAYDAAGGPSGSLGWPVSGPSVVTANGGGTVQGFAGGAIVSSPAGAFPLTGVIRAFFNSIGGIGGTLSWPTAGQVCVAGTGCSQQFRGGKVIAPEGQPAYRE